MVGWRVGRRKQLAFRDMLLEVDQEGVLDLSGMKEGGQMRWQSVSGTALGEGKGGGKRGKGAEEAGLRRG